MEGWFIVAWPYVFGPNSMGVCARDDLFSTGKWRGEKELGEKGKCKGTKWEPEGKSKRE